MDNIQIIKNVKVSYSTTYVENMWTELYARRDKLLSTTDWTQLNDSRLTQESFNDWRKWRKSLKNITNANYDDIQAAIKALENIKKLQPSSAFVDNIEENEVDDIQFIKEEIIKLTNELHNIRDSVHNNNETPIPRELITEKADAIHKVKNWYDRELTLLSYVPISIIFERSKQAVDYIVGNDISHAPLVKNHANINGNTFTETSQTFINNRKLLMQKLQELDVISEKCTREIEYCDKVEKIKPILSNYKID